MATQTKYWCYTLNNPTEDDKSPPQALWTYHVVGHETGSSGTSHFQGYIEMNKLYRLTGMAKLFPRAHLEPRKGTAQQAADYCKKDGDFQEYGTISLPKNTNQIKAQKRNWDEAFQAAKTGDFESIPKDMLTRYYHSYKRIKQDYQQAPPPLADVCGIWFVGPPRTGKSHTARERYPGYYDKPCNKWFDGYQGEETIIIDDFDTNHLVLGHHLKRWADKYAFPAEHKGTTVQIRPKRIVVTSNYSIEEIFYADKTLQEALLRRFTVEEFNTVYDK